MNVTSPPEGFAGSTADVVGLILFERTGERLIAFHDDTRTALERVQTRPGGPYVQMRGPISRHISARLRSDSSVLPLEVKFPIWFDATAAEIAEKIIENLITEFP